MMIVLIASQKGAAGMMRYIVMLIGLIPFYSYTTTFVVTNTNDAGSGSLRQAMLDAQTDATPPSLITFNITGGVPQVITPLSTLPTIQTTTTIDGTTQLPGWVPGDDMPIVIDCTQLAIVAPTGFCLLIDSASNCLIKGFAIQSYVGDTVNGNAIRIRSTTAIADSNQINNCYFGCNADGSVPSAPPFPDNTRSIVLRGNSAFAVTNTVIGGTNAGDGNLLVNTSVNAIAIEFNCNNTLIQNNLFGTDKTGTVAVGGNPYDIAIFGYDGVNPGTPCNNTIIRNNVLANNNISGAAAINLQQDVNDTIIDDNKIGTDITGTVALGNVGAGINTVGSLGFSVTGTQITNNVISGNPQGGIFLNDFTDSSIIQGNKIGTDVTGMVAIPNSVGILIQADTGGPSSPASSNLIGGSSAGQGNIISGNTGAGIELETDVIDTTITGNIIGLNASANAALPNAVGIQLVGAAGASVTGSLINNNTISSNTGAGINLGANAVSNTIQANFIGTNSSGAAFGNGSSGIIIAGTTGLPATSNLIGDTSSANGNVIAYNGTTTTPSYGVIVGGDATTPDVLNAILGNSIFLNNNNGIELVNNGNDLQAPPIVVSASGSDSITITATAPTLPATSTFRLEFFANASNRNPITEGQEFIGAINDVTSGTTVTQTFPISGSLVGKWISGTASDLNGLGDNPGDTSPFSLNIAGIVACPSIPGQNIWRKIDDLGKCLSGLIITEGQATCDCVNKTVQSVSDELTALLVSIIDILT